MKRIVVANVLILVLCFFFYQMNGSLYQFIYFNPTQSFFTRLDFLFLYLIKQVIFLVFAYSFFRIRKKITKESYKRIIHFELLIILIIGLCSTLAYMYFVFYPIVPDVVVLLFVPVYRIFVLIYIIEFVVLLKLLLKEKKESFVV